MKKECVITLVIALFICMVIHANDNPVRKETYVYAVKETDSLRLDKYDLSSGAEAKPCIIFMFGGGFVSGTRDRAGYIDYFNYLVSKGFTVVSIDYRLGMKNLNSSDPMRIIAKLNNSIAIAVEDLFDGTAFVVQNASKWNIDKDMIIANGSSAGAVSVLHGEYAICNKAKVTEKLPNDFKYAAIISFAGAIFSTEGDLKWPSSPAPLLLFHGDADSNVPYDKVELANYGFYGSKHIAAQLEEMKSPYFFFDMKNAAHEIADNPMRNCRDEINILLDKFVKQKLPLMIHSEIEQIGKPELKKDFNITDYIKTNFK
ncbi:alpha/beta hydrolase [Prevotella sp. 10(H)]|uniref:alpha/beta hydrolase family protein n=1 Tax=Prevotella sp. 10(H) TaxID=1158294 RepID=UPI0004A76744|nr:alpha/beta hydrolase [Prevotella sp. 10(H)]